MHSRSAPVIVMLAVMLTSWPAFAAPLSSQQISGFISSLEELSTMEDEFTRLTGDLDDDADELPPDFTAIISDAVNRFRGHPNYELLEDVVERHGFESAEQWGRTGDRVIRAYMTIQIEAHRTEVEKEMADALADLDNNPHITPEQKAQMKAMMENALVAMEQASQAPEEDIRAVRPFVDQLRSVTDGE